MKIMPMTAGKFEISNGGIEVLKWLAPICMTIDHINRFLLDMQYPAMYAIGRLAMPIFGFVFAYNLGRSATFRSDIQIRTMKRLLIFGLIATPIYGVLFRWMPVNIMFTLLTVSYLIYIVENNQPNKWLKFTLVFLIIGFFVEYA